MTRDFKWAAFSFAVALGLPAVGLAHPLPPSQAGVQAKRNAIEDIAGAQTALSSGHPITALTDTQNAETVLLNAQQAGSLQYPEVRTLAALSSADRDLQTGRYGAAWDPAAASALNTAAADLR
jgi:hypothetical protein